jgi:tetratricopeptide (TPR) repeat protein
MQLRNALLVLLASVGLAAPAAAQYQPWKGASVLADPEWRDHFLGSYGFLSGAEPDVAPAELAVLREVIELLQVNPRAAEEMLEQQTGESSSAAFDFILANLEFQSGQLPAARTHYESALSKFPDFRRAHKNLGLLLVQDGDCRGALGHLARAVELGDRDGRNYGLLGYCHLTLENHVAAEVAYRNAILQQPDTRDWKLGLARSLLAIEHYRDAAALFETLIAADPEDPTPWLLQANAYVGLDEPLAAASNLEAVRMLGKAQTSSLVLLGDIYMNAGMSEFAASAYTDAIEGDAGGVEFPTAYRAAELLVRARKNDDAQKVLASIRRRYAKELGEDEELQVLTLEARLARAQGQEKQAAQLLESIVARDGTRGDALLELAAYHRAKGEPEKALIMVERASRLEAWEYPALLDHAQLLVADRDYAGAAELLRRALAIRREPRVETFLARVEQAVRQ